MPKASSCANPLFLKWVQEFHDEKDYRRRGGPPRATGYENAIRALQACTTKYEHPKELRQLTGVGPTCIERLTAKLEEYCERRGIEMPEYVPPRRSKAAANKTTTKRPPKAPAVKPAPAGKNWKINPTYPTVAMLVTDSEDDMEDSNSETESSSEEEKIAPLQKSTAVNRKNTQSVAQEVAEQSRMIKAAQLGELRFRRTKMVARKTTGIQRVPIANLKGTENDNIVELTDSDQEEEVPRPTKRAKNNRVTRSKTKAAA